MEDCADELFMSIELCSKCFGSGEKGANVAATLPKIGGCLPFVVDDEGTPVAFRQRAGGGGGKWG